MKIENITADNFLRLNLFDVTMVDATVHLFAGANEAGKSSVQEAIRFALSGETIRLGPKPLKRDYALMVRDGAKNGSVRIQIDGTSITRDIKTGKLQDSDAESNILPPFLPYLLDAQKFAHEKSEVRRSALIRLTDTKVGGQDIARRMKAKGVSESCIEKVLPMLRSGFTATHKEAQTRASDARQQWVGLTGNARYGSSIAADWKPKVPDDYDPGALLALEQELEALQKKISAGNVESGRRAAALDDARNLRAKQEETSEFDQEKLDALEAKIGEYRKDLQASKDEYESVSAQLASSTEKCPVTCMHCGEQMRVSFVSEPGKGIVAQVTEYVPLPEDEYSALMARVDALSRNRRNCSEALEIAMNEFHAMSELSKAAQGGTEPMTQERIKELADAVADIDGQVSVLLEEQAEKYPKVMDLRAAAVRVKDAVDIEKRAQELHRSVGEWEKCVEALAPDGIPAEILSDTLKPVNDRLRETCLATGWPQITIDPTMQVLADGRRYGLLSESARWRADAAIADAISHLSGLQLLILDRVDVLDLQNRAALMTWINGIKGEYSTILLFATLKKLPKLPEGMAGHWLVNGECAQETGNELNDSA
ncbi:MAG TPA: hypothetical protein ENJ35_04385 [Gammaproteobacteria bacterium]|nr:hypothetical protein [Gammaproteobacteria bacterium]